MPKRRGATGVAELRIKLDQGLIQEIVFAPSRSTGWLRARTGSGVATEAVETDAGLAVLHSLGIKAGQGCPSGDRLVALQLAMVLQGCLPMSYK